MGALDFLDFLGRIGPTSPGQPVGGGGFTPNENWNPAVQAPPPPEVDPAEMPGAGGGWKQGLKSALPGLLGALGVGLASKGFGGDTLSALAGFTGGFADRRREEQRRKQEEDFRTQRAMGDAVHQAWKEMQGADLSMLPPELAHLRDKKAEFDQKYAASMLGTSAGGKAISPKEHQELLALTSVIKGALPKVERFSKDATAAAPYTSAIESGQMEPPPGAERIAEMGLPGDEASRLAGIEAMRGADLSRAQYETPQFNEELGFMTTPREEVTLRGQQYAADRAANALRATEANRLRVDSDRDRAFNAQQERFAAAEARRDAEARAREDRFNRMPVAVQTVDENGNPVTRFVTREGLAHGGGSEFNKPIPNAERLKTKEAANALQQINEAGALFKPEFVGPVAGRTYALAEKFPDMGQIDPVQSAFFAQNKTIMNATIKLITGAQMSEQEAQRILGQVPTVNDPPDVWQAKYAQTKKNAEMLQRIMGGQMPPPLGGPEGGSTGAPSTIPPGMKLQRNRRTGETRLVPIGN